MADRNEYAPGTPNWVDLQTTDQPAAQRFYTGLFGWDYDEQPMPDGPVYAMGTIRGRHVAAIAPMPPGGEGMPPHWNSYVSVSDVDAITGRVAGAGGTVLMEPFDVMDAGRMSVVLDPTGAPINIWQAKNNIGAQVVNEAGAFTWSELSTSDVDRAAGFYAKVFGWDAQKFPEMDYTVFNNGGQGIAGAMKSPAEGMPSYWLVYFAVDDTDATVAKARDLGANVMVEPTDIPEVGRFAMLADPQGAAFGVIKNAS